MIAAMRLVTLLLLLGAVAMPQQWPPRRDIPAGPADTLYYNGKIITMWAERPVVESMTVASGRVLDVGTTQIVGRKTGPRTRQVNLQGKTVLPGLIDSHVHPISAALAEADGEIPVLRSFEAVRRHVEAQPAGEGLIFVPKVYSTRLRERRYPELGGPGTGRRFGRHSGSEQRKAGAERRWRTHGADHRSAPARGTAAGGAQLQPRADGHCLGCDAKGVRRGWANERH